MREDRAWALSESARAPRYLLLIASLMVTLCACEALGLESDRSVDPEHRVEVEVKNADGVTETVVVHGIEGNKKLRDAIAHMSNEDWSEAVSVLTAASSEEERDDDQESQHHEHFALAVIHEKLGQFDDAIVHYKRANFLMRDPQAVRGRERCEAHSEVDL